MSVVCFVRPGSRTRILAGDIPKWVSNNARASYIASVCVSAPPWVDRTELEMLRHWARAMTVFHKRQYVLDHEIPVNHPRVCGLTVPWNMVVCTWEVTAAKGNKFNPDQMEIFQ